MGRTFPYWHKCITTPAEVFTEQNKSDQGIMTDCTFGIKITAKMILHRSDGVVVQSAINSAQNRRSTAGF